MLFCWELHFIFKLSVIVLIIIMLSVAQFNSNAVAMLSVTIHCDAMLSVKKLSANILIAAMPRIVMLRIVMLHYVECHDDACRGTLCYKKVILIYYLKPYHFSY